MGTPQNIILFLCLGIFVLWALLSSPWAGAPRSLARSLATNARPNGPFAFLLPYLAWIGGTGKTLREAKMAYRHQRDHANLILYHWRNPPWENSPLGLANRIAWVIGRVGNNPIMGRYFDRLVEENPGGWANAHEALRLCSDHVRNQILEQAPLLQIERIVRAAHVKSPFSLAQIVREIPPNAEFWDRGAVLLHTLLEDRGVQAERIIALNRSQGSVFLAHPYWLIAGDAPPGTLGSDLWWGEKIGTIARSLPSKNKRDARRGGAALAILCGKLLTHRNGFVLPDAIPAEVRAAAEETRRVRNLTFANFYIGKEDPSQ